MPEANVNADTTDTGFSFTVYGHKIEVTEGDQVSASVIDTYEELVERVDTINSDLTELSEVTIDEQNIIESTYTIRFAEVLRCGRVRLLRAAINNGGNAFSGTPKILKMLKNADLTKAGLTAIVSASTSINGALNRTINILMSSSSECTAYFVDNDIKEVNITLAYLSKN